MRDKIIKLRSGRLGRTRQGHPWIYKNQLLKTDPSIKPGDIVSIIDSEGKSAGTGYYNPRSEISVRILSSKDEPIDESFFADRIRMAADKRKQLLSGTNAYRAVFSESDSLPGLIVDIYSDTAVFQILTLGMESFKPIIVKVIKDILATKYIYEKSDSPFGKLEGLKDVKKWHGPEGRTLIEIFEGRARFVVDIEHGHKTGFYLDQRKSRAALGNICEAKKVLDLFCYTGGFSINAAINGAEHVYGVDIKNEWLELARRNAELNGISGKMEFINGDVFDILKDMDRSGKKFDIVIIDPPSFLKNKGSLASAAKGYLKLNTAGMKILSDGGILATFSCSHNMPNEIFSQSLKNAARNAGKKIVILKRCHQAEDHPIVRAIPETNYLKGYFLKIESETI